MSWCGEVADFLREAKDAGVPFDAAWREALVRFPARSWEYGDASPRLFGGGEPSVVAFFERACREAWAGERPALRHFRTDMLRGMDDYSTGAARRPSGRPSPSTRRHHIAA